MSSVSPQLSLVHEITLKLPLENIECFFFNWFITLESAD